MALFMIVRPTTVHCPACELDHEWAAGDVTLSNEPVAPLRVIALEGVADLGASYVELGL
jgi:hypothetical protein